MLLFKLPSDMISASSERALAYPSRNNDQEPFVVSPSLHRHGQPHNQADLTGGLENAEQQISLTIPLASLGTADLATSEESRAVPGNLDYFKFSQQPSASRHSSEQRLLSQYISPSLGQSSSNGQAHGILMTSASEPQLDSSYVRVLPGRDEMSNEEIPLQAHAMNQLRRPNDQHQQMLANASLIEQQMRQLLVQRQILQHQIQQVELYNSALKTSTQTPTSSSSEQPTEAPQLWRDSLVSSQRQPTSGYAVANATGAQQVNVDSSQLLNRLAGSSPELLMRLRSMLRKASGLQAARNSTSDRMPAYTDYSDILSSSSQNPADKAMLQNFLQSHNLSSHEEIKIPLLVIAMPRILSLKRDQLLSNNQKQASGQSNSSISSISSLYGSKLTPSSAWIKSLASAANLTAPYLRPNEQLDSPANADQAQTTTSSPHQTMAPYARQFGPSAQQASIARYFARPSSPAGSPPSSQVKMAPKPLVASQKSSYLETTLNPIGSHFAYPPSQIAKQIVEQTAASGRQPRQQSIEVDTRESSPGEGAPLSRDHILVRVNRDQESNPNLRLIQLRRMGSLQNRAPAAYEYLVRTNTDNTDQRHQLALEPAQQSVESSSSRATVSLDTLSRLRPLFQAQRAIQENRLSNEQMLSLMARASRPHDTLSATQSAPEPHQVVPNQSPSGQKKSPKMVFMIV